MHTWSSTSESPHLYKSLPSHLPSSAGVFTPLCLEHSQAWLMCSLWSIRRLPCQLGHTPTLKIQFVGVSEMCEGVSVTWLLLWQITGCSHIPFHHLTSSHGVMQYDLMPVVPVPYQYRWLPGQLGQTPTSKYIVWGCEWNMNAYSDSQYTWDWLHCIHTMCGQVLNIIHAHMYMFSWALQCVHYTLVWSQYTVFHSLIMCF